jgi:CDGSH-type Zn-finger protein
MDERVVIKVRDNGPYKVTGPVDLVDAEGNRFSFDADRPLALCRCGRSATKPFCDRSHRETGFEACERADAA